MYQNKGTIPDFEVSLLPKLSQKELKDIRAKQKEFLINNKVKSYGTKTSVDKYKLVSKRI